MEHHDVVEALKDIDRLPTYKERALERLKLCERMIEWRRR
jgi:hypothetical protein